MACILHVATIADWGAKLEQNEEACNFDNRDSTSVIVAETAIYTIVQTSFQTETSVASVSLPTNRNFDAANNRELQVISTVQIPYTVTSVVQATAYSTAAQPSLVITHTYNLANSGVGCANTAYTDFEQDFTITLDQCLTYCSQRRTNSTSKI